MSEGDITISLVIKGTVVGQYAAGAAPKVGDIVNYEGLGITERTKRYTVDLAAFEWRVVNNKLRTVFINVTEVAG